MKNEYTKKELEIIDNLTNQLEGIRDCYERFRNEKPEKPFWERKKPLIGESGYKILRPVERANLEGFCEGEVVGNLTDLQLISILNKNRLQLIWEECNYIKVADYLLKNYILQKRLSFNFAQGYFNQDSRGKFREFPEEFVKHVQKLREAGL